MRNTGVTAVLLGVAGFTFALPAHAQAPLRVLSSNGVKAVIEDLQPDIERNIGRPLSIEFSTAASLAREIETGTPFDVAILTPALLERLIEIERVAAASYVELARAGVGVGARPNTGTRDVASPAALRRTLLAAESVAFTAGGQSRAAIDAAFEQLGITEQMQAKTRLLGPGEAPHVVADGGAELVLTLVSEILPVPGLELVGPLPAELQRYVSFAAARSTDAREIAASDALLAYLAGPAVAAALAEHGMERVGGSASNGYVPAPPLPRDFVPPPALDLSGEGYVELPMAGGARLYYWDTGGDGEAIVLVHAGTGSAFVWSYQQRALADAGFRVIAYSRRGYRGSDPGPIDARNRALPDSGRPLDDLEALVTHLKLEKFHLLGHAAGGGIANGYIKAHPERILSSINVAAIQSIAEDDWTVPMLSLREPGDADDLGAFNSNPAELREVGPSYRWANPSGLAAWIELEHTNRPARVDHAAGIEVTWADIESRTFPTLLIAGDADLYAPPSMYRYLHARIPHSELHVVPEAGHSVYWEQPETFNRLVLEFLARH